MPLRNALSRPAPLLLAFFLVVPVRAAHAQFGSLVRRAKEKVEQAAKDRSGAGDSTATASPGHPVTVRNEAHVAEPKSPLGPYVTEFTPDMVDRALLALDAEQRQAVRIRRRETQRLANGQGNAELDAYQKCFDKAVSEYQGDMKRIQKRCGTAQGAQQKHEDRMNAEKDAELADSAALHVTVIATPDSAGAVGGGFGSQREWGTVKERITAFLLLDASGAIGQCMKTQRLQYIFTDAETTLLRSRRAELEKRFLDKELTKLVVWGRCTRAT